MSNTQTTPTVFLDSIGRTLLGVIAKQNETEITVENPALVLIQANPETNQLQLQIIPLFFKEFQSDRNTSTFWNFKKNNITLSEAIDISPQLLTQYNQLFAVQPPAKQSEPATVKLFDE